MLNYEAAGRRLPRVKQATVVGNPVRSKVKSISRSEARRALGLRASDFVILSFGGSLGAARLNEVIAEVIEVYSSRRTGVVHIHATGRAEYEKYAKLQSRLRGGSKILPYINDIPTYLNAADIAITRAGAMTLSELAAAGIPAILIPSPNVTANHQYENARSMCDENAATMIEEKELTVGALIERIEQLRKSPVLRNKISQNLKKFDLDTPQRILEVIERVTKGGKQAR